MGKTNHFYCKLLLEKRYFLVILEKIGVKVERFILKIGHIFLKVEGRIRPISVQPSK